MPYATVFDYVGAAMIAVGYSPDQVAEAFGHDVGLSIGNANNLAEAFKSVYTGPMYSSSPEINPIDMSALQNSIQVDGGSYTDSWGTFFDAASSDPGSSDPTSDDSSNDPPPPPGE